MLRTIEPPNGVWTLKIITFLAAFLLFQIELIIAKILLPHYGGSYLVWGACVVFFQAILLLGYVFSHYAIGKWGIIRYRVAHLILLLIPLLFFPGRPLADRYAVPIVMPMESRMPLALDIFLRLLTTIGPVFFVLSTISIVTQVWLSTSQLSQRNNPYALYAVSNMGSFGALVTYPFFFEACLDLSVQTGIWRILYFLLIGLNVWAYLKVGVKETERRAKETVGLLKFSDYVSWLLLGAAGVIIFLSVTHIITNEIAPVPLLWVIPLGIYLLSFVFNFQQRPRCPSWIVRQIHLILGFSALLYFLVVKRYFPFTISLILLSTVQFILCMYCQNQLAIQRPKDDSHLTRFYVAFSFGGFVGGLFTTWIIPLISQSLVEYLMGLLVIAVTLVFKEKEHYVSARHILLIAALTSVLIALPIVFVQYNVFALAMVFMIFKVIYVRLQKSAYALSLSLILMLAVAYYAPALWNQRYQRHSVYIERNYYGISEVMDWDGIRRLYHGKTLHGAQYLQKERRGELLAYYAASSPLGEIFSSDIFSFQRLGIIGLGTGMMSAYTKEGQMMDFYELDPDIYAIADKYFTFIHEAKGKLNFIFGDARLSLDKNPGAKYDFLLVDAFGGDAIPVHLLTKEGIEKYRAHLYEKGILMFHISNRYLDLRQILGRVASSLGAYGCYKISEKSPLLGETSTWMIMTWDKAHFDTLTLELGWKQPPENLIHKARLWTDQYSSILSTIKSGDLQDSIKNFKPFYW
jgi:hypothetical protein